MTAKLYVARLPLIMEMDVGDPSNAAADCCSKLDAFREAVQPTSDHDIVLITATYADLGQFPTGSGDSTHAGPVVVARNLWANDKKYPRADWAAEVASYNTNAGYWEWVFHRYEVDREDAAMFPKKSKKKK